MTISTTPVDTEIWVRKANNHRDSPEWKHGYVAAIYESGTVRTWKYGLKSIDFEYPDIYDTVVWSEYTLINPNIDEKT